MSRRRDRYAKERQVAGMNFREIKDMDYILSEIQRNIELYEHMPGQRRTMVEFFRIKFEYACSFLLGYLWNKNISHLTEDERVSFSDRIARPSIGTIVSICRNLDREKEFFGKNKAIQSIRKISGIQKQVLGPRISTQRRCYRYCCR